MAFCDSNRPCKYDHPTPGSRYGRPHDGGRKPPGWTNGPHSHWNHTSGFRQADAERKAAEAGARKAAWDNLTLQQQLAALDKRQGKSARQRARILKQIETAKTAAQLPKAEKKSKSTRAA